MAQPIWRGALRNLIPVFFTVTEAERIESTISSERADTAIENQVREQEHPLWRAKAFKFFTVPETQRLDVDWGRFDTRLIRSWDADVNAPRAHCCFPEYNKSNSNSSSSGGILDMSQTLVWLPGEDNKYSLGREGSTRVNRISARPEDFSPEFLPFWEANNTTILSAVFPTNESDSELKEAVKWAAAALDGMLCGEALRLRAGGGPYNDRYIHDYGELKLLAATSFQVGEHHLDVSGSGDVELSVSVVGVARRNNEISVVLKVLWKGELWWLKLGPEADTRFKALQAPDDLPAGGWERWFQTERDLLSRHLLGCSGNAFAVQVAEECCGGNRPGMLVRDAGESVEKRLRAGQVMQPDQVEEMSRQLYSALEASGERGVIHGDVCLENICERDGVYSLIDWGLACGRPFEKVAAAVEKTWAGVVDVNETPGIPNWEMSPECCFLGVRPYSTEHDLESLLYCCMKLLGGNVLPWSDAAVSGSELEVLSLRAAAVESFLKSQERFHVHRPLLLRLGLISGEDTGEWRAESMHDVHVKNCSRNTLDFCSIIKSMTFNKNVKIKLPKNV